MVKLAARRRSPRASSSSDGFALVYVIASLAFVAAVGALLTMLPHPSEHVEARRLLGACAALVAICLAFEARRDPYLACQYVIVVAALTAMFGGVLVAFLDEQQTLGWVIVSVSVGAIVTACVQAIRMGRRASPIRARFPDAQIFEENGVQWTGRVGRLEDPKRTRHGKIELFFQNCVDAKRKIDVSFLYGRWRIGPEPSPRSPACLPTLTELELAPAETRTLSIPMSAAPGMDAFRIEVQALVRGWGGKRVHPWRAQGAQRSVTPLQSALFALFGYDVFGGGIFLEVDVSGQVAGDDAAPAEPSDEAGSSPVPAS
jgi:hypothetical protein